MSESYFDSAASFIRDTVANGHDPRDVFDDWRNQYSVTCDGVELYSAWSKAMDEFEKERHD